MTRLKPIKTAEDYHAALAELSKFFDNNPDEVSQEDSDYFDILLILVEKYEDEHCPMLPPEPIEAIRFRMEQMGLEVKDMEGIIGKPNRVYEVMNGTRPLSLRMIKNLHQKLGISADVLLGGVVV